MEKNLRMVLVAVLASLVLVACDDEKTIEPNPEPPIDGPSYRRGGVFTIVNGDTILMDGYTYKLPTGQSSWVIDLYSNGIYHYGGMRITSHNGLDVRFITPNFSWETYPATPWKPTSCMAGDRDLESEFLCNPVYHQQIEITPDYMYTGAKSMEIRFEAQVTCKVWQADTKFVLK